MIHCKRFSVLLLTALLLTQGVMAQEAEPKKKAAKRAPNPTMAKIEDDPKLPRVLLIGDSISIGYTLAVREKLHGQANVHRIPTNGGPTTNGLKNLKTWLGDGKWDVIHFNWGLHDLKFMSAEGGNLADPKAADSRQQVPLPEYEKHLAELVKQLQATGAKLIWCATTPVPAGAAGRVADDSVKYNEAAARVMKAAGVTINDLHAYAVKGPSGTQLPKNVHYSAAGYRYLADEVAKHIAAALPASDKKE
jgi:lysophospholipase L1-like esterase